jgi:spore maturation protein CgeB
MNILYYTWNEITKDDIVEQIGKEWGPVDIVDFPLKSYTKDPEFVVEMENALQQKAYDCIFTINYIPLISKISYRNQITYISWVFDSPSVAMYSEMIFNPYNYIFHFDSSEVEKFRKKGVRNIWHMPLAVNLDRIDRLITSVPEPDGKLINSEVEFMGTLYTDNFNYWDKINGMPDYDNGFVNGLIDMQLRVMGYDLIEETIPEQVMQDMLKHVTFTLDEEMFITEQEMLLFMIRKKATVVERAELLDMLSRHFKTTLYSQSDSSKLPSVDNRGYLGYSNEMPVMFYHSAINLNITLRNIKSGISLRAMDIMGAGGFLLSNYQPELVQYFKEGEEMAVYYDRNDLLYKVQYYLEHEEERKRIAENGRKRIEKDFTYSVQLGKMFKIVFPQ